MRVIIFLYLLSFIACRQHKTQRSETLHPLSAWLIANEDSLLFYFKQTIRGDTSIPFAANETLSSSQYQLEDGFIGQLTKKIHDFDSCIQVYYLFKPDQQPAFQLLLSPNYNEKCLSIVDSIFNDIDTLNHFRIVRYRPAGGLFSAFIMETDTIRAEELYFEVIPQKQQFDVNIFVGEKISDLTKEELLSNVFGEEVRLKKINTVNFLVRKDSTKMDLEEVRKFFDVQQ